VWEVVESAQVAARPGRVWRVVNDHEGHADRTGNGEVRAIRIDVADEPRELAWTSPRSFDDGEQLEVQWWFRLAPSWNGTEVEHGVRVPRPPAASEQLELRQSIVETLATVKARAERL
jgi:hypothetical protein